MKWKEITIHSNEEAEEMITNFLHELGSGGVSVEESSTIKKQRDTSFGQWYELTLNNIPEGRVEIRGYFSEGIFSEDLVTELKESIAMLKDLQINTGEISMSIREVNEEEWATAWKKYYKPIRITEKLTIKPTWEVYEASADEHIIELDPGMAFGTGSHATTALCLETLESVIQGGEDVIDVGTGSGVLAIAAAKLGAKHVLALDLDPVAVSSATENVHINHLESQITTMKSDLLQVIRSDNEGKQALNITLPVQIVVANILADIIISFIDDVYDVLETGGTFIASGIWKNKEDDVEKALLASKFSIAAKNRSEDWVAFVARKQ